MTAEAVGIPAALTALALISAAWVLLPFFRSGGRAALTRGADAEQEALVERRAAAYAAMDELDQDLELGKLDAADYRELYDRLRVQAIAALQLSREREVALSARIERDVRAARLSGAAASPAASVTPVPMRGAGGAAPLPAGTASGSRPTSVGRAVTVAAPSRWARLLGAVERRPLPWAGAFGALFLAFAAATGYVWLEGARGAASARPIGVVGGAEHAALLLDGRRGAWALSGDATGVRRSADGGASWSGVPVLPGRVTALARDAEGASVYALIEGRLYRSADDGATWIRSGRPPRGARLSALAGDPAAPRGLVALDGDGSLYTSPDAGVSWRRESFPPAGALESVTVASLDPLSVYAAGSGIGVVSGRDGRWTDAGGVVNGRLPTDAIRSVAYDPASGDESAAPGGGGTRGALYVATDRGVFRSTDGGQDWVGLGIDRDLRALALGPPGSGLMVAVTANGEVYRSTDRGVTWDGE